MTLVATPRPPTPTVRRAPARRSARRPVGTAPVVAPPVSPAVKLERLTASWERALASAERALVSAGGTLPPAERMRRRRELLAERHDVAAAVVELAHVAGVRPAPWLPPFAVRPALLGLPTTARACLFDLEGVLTDSGLLHARVWAEVLDDFLVRLAERAGRHFVPFDRTDYAAYFDGRGRVVGIRGFLDARGIRLPDGDVGDAAGTETVHGLARRKAEALEVTLRRRRVASLPGARRYLEAVGRAGLRRAVLSASASTLSMIELAGLTPVVDERIDAGVAARERLRPAPAADVPLAACRHLDVRPDEVVAFTRRPAAVAAARAAGLTVVGIGSGSLGECLLRAGAERVAPSLGSLLDRRLRPAAP